MFTIWTKKVNVRLNTFVAGMPEYHEIYLMPGFRFVAGVDRIMDKVYMDGKSYPIK